MAAFDHFQYYLDEAKRFVAELGIERPKILKTDAYNEMLDLPDTGGIANNIDADVTMIEYQDVFDRKVRRMGFNVVKGDIRNMPFKDKTFDGILDFSTIDHVSINDLPGTFAEYARVLKSHGKILVFAWNAENPMVSDATEERGKTWTALNQYFFPPKVYKEIFESFFLIQEEWKFLDGGDTYLKVFRGEKK